MYKLFRVFIATLLLASLTTLSACKSQEETTTPSNPPTPTLSPSPSPSSTPTPEPTVTPSPTPGPGDPIAFIRNLPASLTYTINSFDPALAVQVRGGSGNYRYDWETQYPYQTEFTDPCEGYCGYTSILQITNTDYGPFNGFTGFIYHESLSGMKMRVKVTDLSDNSSILSQELIITVLAALPNPTPTPPPRFRFTLSSSEVSEGVNTALVEVKLIPALETPATVEVMDLYNYDAQSGVDYTFTPTTLTFAPGETVKTVSVNIVDDSDIELQDDVLVLYLTNPVGAATNNLNTHYMTIKDNEPIPKLSFTEASGSGIENVGSVTVEVKLNIAQPTDVSVMITSQGVISATLGYDYSFTPTTLTFAPGETSKTFSFNVINNLTQTPTRVIAFYLQGITGAIPESPTTFSYTIEDNDPAPLSINNPYHAVPSWKIWDLDNTPVYNYAGPALGNRLYAHDPNPATPLIYVDYKKNVVPANSYAHIWDDGYASLDGNHSFVDNSWSGANGNSVTGVHASITTLTNPTYVLMKHYGLSYTSQSTTGQGHDLANNRMSALAVERDYYFTNILRSSPTHISFMDRTKDFTDADEYRALFPAYYNSMGSSGSEERAITKMILASGYLPRTLKTEIKRNGALPATMLYIWKSALPYDVPYDHELKHRVAYASKGDHTDYTGTNTIGYNFYYHFYDEDKHFKNMIDIAKNMTVAPPISILKKIAITGGTVVYDDLKTSMLVNQAANQTVTIEMDPKDSYDLQGLPLTYRVTQIIGTPGTIVTQDSITKIFTITVPYDSTMPRGRTTLLLIANNGYYDSNPAAINVYREYGNMNRRPTITWPKEYFRLPGESLNINFAVSDFENKPIEFTRWSDEPGQLVGANYEWNIDAGAADNTHKIHFIASDKSAGNSHESAEILVNVKSTIAQISADTTEGPAPHTVSFSSNNSRDKNTGPLLYFWDFDDGLTSTAENPSHTFVNPGVYRVQLTVTGPSGSHTTSQIIHATQNWNLVHNNGWSTSGLDNLIWSKLNSATPTTTVTSGTVLRMVNSALETPDNYGLATLNDFSYPLFVDITYWSQKSPVASQAFQIFDAVIGHTPQATNDEDLHISVNTGGSTWAGPFVGKRTRDMWQNTNIKIYIDLDPNYPGQVRYQGVIESELGTHLIRLENQPTPTEAKIKILQSIPKSRIDIMKLKAYSP